MDIREVQRRAWTNKVRQGFNTANPFAEIDYIYDEVGEAADALENDRAGLGGELADIVIFVAGLAEMTGVDLSAAVQEKLTVNESRTYVTNEDGVRVKVATPTNPATAGLSYFMDRARDALAPVGPALARDMARITRATQVHGGEQR